MSLPNNTRNDVLNVMFKNISLPWAPNTNIWVALYTAEPSITGDPTIGECAYTNYARVAINRATGLNVASGVLSNAALVQFPESASNQANATHFAFVTTATGAGQIIDRGALLSPLTTNTNITPQFNAGALTTTVT